MTSRLRTAALTIAAGGGLAVVGVLFGPAGPANAASVDIHLDATSGTTVLPGRATPVPVWGYCLRTAAATPCASVSAPGGPTLEVSQGDDVTVTLHNTLAETTALRFGGQALVPDTTGAAAGATATYSFTASRPGTYLYEAGLTPNSQHQVAMGLYGALVVKPATNPDHQVYDASTTYDTEAVLVLGEVDPALNDAADPAAFDMRAYRPRWTLINGRAHPATTAIPAASGQKVLLRWVNAASSYHSMGVLGADQRFVAFDGSQLRNGAVDISRRHVAETFGPGQTADAVVTVPETPTTRRLAVYDTSLTLHNATASGAGGMLTVIEVAGTGTTAPDTSGPATTGVTWATGAPDGTLTATVSDAATGDRTIKAAEYYVDSIAGAPVAMTPVTTLDSATEQFTASLPVPPGQHVLYVRGQDDRGALPDPETDNWGPFSSVLVTGSDAVGPTTTAVALTPDRTDGTVAVTVTATGNDSASGNSAIAEAEWSIDGGAATAMTLETTGPVAGVVGSIAQPLVLGLSEGDHSVAVRTRDAAGNWGPTSTAILVVDLHGPTASDVTATPNPSNGQVPVNGSSPAVRLSATLTDLDARSGIAKAEAFVGTPGAVGSGIPMAAADGAFGSPTENVYLDIPLTTVRQMTEGDNRLYVRGRDTAGAWGDAVFVNLLVDRTGPAITGLTLAPNPTNGAPFVSLTATVTDALSAVSTVEWFVGTDPGVGNGTPVTPAPDGSISATISTAALAEGDVTVTVRARDALGNTRSAAQQLQVRRPLWFSTVGNTNPPGVAGTADDSDIYSWSGSGLSRELDLSAAPYLIPLSANVDGYSRVSATSFYVSFTGTVTLPVLGTVQDEDVVLWNGSAWSMYFDGSARAVGNVDLDAISVRDGQLYFSVDTNASPPGAGGTGDDADIYRWDGTSTYTRVVDASTIGVPSTANVDGFTWAGAADWLFSFSGNATVTGLGATQDEDVLRRTGTTWSVYFDGTARGLTNNNHDVDAFDIP